MNTPQSLPSLCPPIFLRIGDRKEAVSLMQIVRFQSERNYTRVYLTDGRQVLMAKTLGAFERLLPSSFVRIHRSHLVNHSFISHWVDSPLKNTLVLTNGQVLTIANRRIKEFTEMNHRLRHKA
ncbi:LytTR family DNA-binding domain-containing protein [Runella sp. SP2]|uniref:LytR/AlgR family response regulator transcription factor n=1 Tax=Runella sp. SP2 TaxID=2268026 RepID=UPI000F088EBB|nr:LytTR family DNA-binding domain-containing protein [Runella sp. SP2]AYQ34683.1 LytTR family transcriptional regulator [Runella sp. SP2]